jgi:hypothetical protein
MVWKREDEGMWIALIRFNRQVEAQLRQSNEGQLVAAGASR